MNTYAARGPPGAGGGAGYGAMSSPPSTGGQAYGGRHAHMHMHMQPAQAPAPYKGTLPPGTKVAVGKYTVTVKRYLSEGGFAHVYLVTSSEPIPIPVASSGGRSSGSAPGVLASGAGATRPETLHVLKRMAVPDREALALVRSEVEAHRLLRGQANIVHFIEASATALPASKSSGGAGGGGYEVFILMEYCAGGGIIDLMNARLRDRLREGEILKIFADVCAGVAVMHHLDPPLMHRDLKVENILLSPDAGPSSSSSSSSSAAFSAARASQATYKLCDFGSAAPVLSRRAPRSLEEVKRVEADLNRATTLQYRAPEMVDVYQRRVIDEKSDIWALGVLLYKLCYYTTPFEENGGGPLAILSATYRFPPSPVYSQNLKDLIASLLREHSVDRPTIDEVLIRAHALLGTPPPPSALHYAAQRAAGRQAAPLPSVVQYSSSSASSSAAPSKAAAAGAGAAPGAPGLGVGGKPPRAFDDTALLSAGGGPRSPTATPSGGLAGRGGGGGRVGDLVQTVQVSGGPAADERARRAEVEALMEGVTPMRRGRPARGAAAGAAGAGAGAGASPAAAAAAARPAMRQLTGERKDASTPASASVDGGRGSATLGKSFGSRFAAAQQAASPTPSGGGGGGGKTASLINGFEDSFAPSPPSSAHGLAPSPALDKGAASPKFGAALSPQASSALRKPLLSTGSGAGAGATGGSIASLTRSFGGAAKAGAMDAKKNDADDDDATSRFPSVEELDARYAPAPAVSASQSRESVASAAASSDSAEPAPPPLPLRARDRVGSPTADLAATVSHRESVGAMASRFNSSRPGSSPGAASSSSAARSPAADKPPAALPHKSTVGSLADRWPHARQHASSTSSAPAATAAPAMSPSSSKAGAPLERAASKDAPPPARPPPRDWLTGDDTEESAAPSPAPEQEEAAKPASPPAATEVPAAAPAPAESDSDDEPEGPEDVAGGSSVADKYGSSAGRRLPSPQRRDPKSLAPQKVKPPAWLAERKDEPPSPSKPESPAPVEAARPAESSSAPAQEIEAQDEEDMDEDDRDLAIIEGRIPSERRRVVAPAWDEMDESEMRALPQQPLSLHGESELVSLQPSALPAQSQLASAPAAVSKPEPAPADSKEYKDQATSPLHSVQPSPVEPEPRKSPASEEARPAAPQTEEAAPSVEDATPAPARVRTLSERMQGLELARTGSAAAAAASKPVVPLPSTASSSVRDRYKPQEGASAGAANGKAARAEPPVILPKPASLPSKRASTIAAVPPPAPAAGLKPWEREAAAAAEYSRAGVVSSAAGARAAPADAEPEPAKVEAQERFRGVSDLISKWQANAKSQAPGWGRIGEAPASIGPSSAAAARRGPNLGADAAAAVGAKRASSVLPRSEAARLPGADV